MQHNATQNAQTMEINEMLSNEMAVAAMQTSAPNKYISFTLSCRCRFHFIVI